MDFPRPDPIFSKIAPQAADPIFRGASDFLWHCTNLPILFRDDPEENWAKKLDPPCGQPKLPPDCGHGPENWIRFSQKLDPERGIPIFQNSKGNVTIPLDSRKIGSGGKIGSRVGNWIPSKNRIRGKNWIPSENWIRAPRVGQGGWGATSGSAAEAPMTAKNLRSTQHTAGGTRQAPSP